MLFIYAFFASYLSASPFDEMLSKESVFKEIDSSADTYEYIGNNVKLQGHVVIRAGKMLLTADKAIVNLESYDIDLSGHVSFSVRETIEQVLNTEEYAKAIKDPYQITKKIGIQTSAIGEKRIIVSITRNGMYMNAERAFMNLQTGSISFKKFILKEHFLYAEGERASRFYDGSINVWDTKFTTCNYLIDGHDHYAVKFSRAVLKPPRENSGLINFSADQSDVSVLGYNAFLQLWGVPVFWFPAFYKPPEEGGFGGRIAFGNRSEWGYFIQASKNFHILDDPYLNANAMLDYYHKRGVGYGLSLDLVTPESSTEFSFYGIRDKSPYEYWGTDSSKDADWKKNNSRLSIPSYRYELRLTNVTHLTPRTDLRAQLDLLSDYNFLNDFFEGRYERVSEPPTYVSLEQQFDRFTASLYTNIRVNKFNSTSERLPELRFDFQRQKLFGNLYYQGETSLGLYRTLWRKFDRESIYMEDMKLKDYSSFRFDSLHMFYYPIKFWNINIIPRAGFRLTAYSKTSKHSVTTDDLNRNFVANELEGQPNTFINNYDTDGGAKLRFTGEIGIEANTKFYRSWQNVKSKYLMLDGLRHVAVPYINYTFIPRPTLRPEKILFFDDIDRIDETHFLRVGLINRLQTRRNGEIFEWFSIENYWDYFFHKSEGFNHIGDLGTIIKFRPTPKFTISTSLLFDLGQSNPHKTSVYRGDKDVVNPGLDCKFLNRWSIDAKWDFAPRWSVQVGYYYIDDYKQRVPYSMGSTLAGMSASQMFYSHGVRGQELYAGLYFPIIDKKTDGYIYAEYDIDADILRRISIGARRQFHCWTVQAELGREGRRGGEKYKKTYSNYFAIYVSLTAMPEVALGHKVN